MILGSMHTSTLIHIARHIKTVDNYKLYAPLCRGVSRRTVAYLGIVEAQTLEDVTCKQCQAKAKKYPHLVQ